ncbi:MAG: hypothetical protein AAF789_01210 [Bacteroidota bacterium]
MSSKQTDILLGRGLGDLLFGMTREKVEEIMGKPDHQEIEEYDGARQDLWEYHAMRLNLTFDEAEDWRLVILSVSSDEYSIRDQQLIGLDMDELMDELNIMHFEDLEVEDASSEDQPNQKLISSDHHAINFWLNDGILEEIQWSPKISDDNTIRWP